MWERVIIPIRRNPRSELQCLNSPMFEPVACIDRVSYFTSIPETMFQILPCKIHYFSYLHANMWISELISLTP